MAQHRSFLFLTIFAAWALGWCGSPVGLEAADGTVKVFILAGQSNMKHFIRDVLVDQAAAELFPTWRDNFEQWQKVGSDRPYHYFGSAIWFTQLAARPVRRCWNC